MQQVLNKLRFIILVIFTAIWFATANRPSSLLTAAAILIHEAGHITASLITGNRLKRLSVRTAGLLLTGDRSYCSYYEEAFIAYCGPLFNFLSSIICLLLSRSENAVFFSGVSLTLGILNLLPIKEFDGGRITDAILYGFLRYDTAYKVSEILSFLSLFFLWSISVYQLMRTGDSITLFLFSTILYTKILLSESKNQN